MVGGTEPRYGGDWAGTITVDMERFSRIIEVDHQSRSGDHFATLYTHIDDLVESTRVDWLIFYRADC